MGVFIHVMGDCANNLGVIIAGLVIWLADYHGRYYADPAVSMAIAVMIFFSSLPLSRLLSLEIYCHITNSLSKTKRSYPPSERS